MLGLLTRSRLALARPSLPRFPVRASVQDRRQRTLEHEYRRMVANGELPREFGAPFTKEDRRQRWF